MSLLVVASLLVPPAPGIEAMPPAAVTPPRPILSGGPTDYPPRALRRREEGDVRVALTVDADGRFSGCEVIKGSGHPDLDDQSCVDMRQTIVGFEPARDANGRAVASIFRTVVHWRLPE